MSTQTATFCILAIYIAAMIGIGLYTSRRTKSTNDFMLGGRNVGSWLTAFSYGTTYFSAVVFIGYAGQFGWNYGVSATWVGIGNAILGSMLPWMILGRRTRLMSNHLGAKTMPEYFERRFDSKALKTASAAIVFCFPDSLHRIGLQRIVTPFRNGFRPRRQRLYLHNHRYGCSFGCLRYIGRICGNCVK